MTLDIYHPLHADIVREPLPEHEQQRLRHMRERELALEREVRRARVGNHLRRKEHEASRRMALLAILRDAGEPLTSSELQQRAGWTVGRTVEALVRRGLAQGGRGYHPVEQVCGRIRYRLVYTIDITDSGLKALDAA